MRLRRTTAGLGLALLPVVGVAVGPAQAEAADYECSQVAIDAPAETAKSASAPFVALHVQEMWNLLARQGVSGRGSGQTVAVLDSGISPAADVRVTERTSFGKAPTVDDYHGTAVAGLLAGQPRPGGAVPKAVGFAPGVDLVDVKIYDARLPSDDQVAPESARLAAGLAWVADNAKRLGITVAVVPFAVPDTPDDSLAAATKRVLAADVVLVAAGGDRPVEGETLYAQLGKVKRGEDARGLVYPASVAGVLTVGATGEGTAPDVRDAVLPNSAIDVAAPTFGAVSLSLNGGTCVLPEVSTAWSAAEVAGVVALLRERFPKESVAQINARLMRTASSRPGAEDPYAGAGVIQPMAALDRRLTPDGAGTMTTMEHPLSADPRARAPRPQPDLLADARDELVWVGLLGIAAIVAAALLRPLLARRRTR